MLSLTTSSPATSLRIEPPEALALGDYRPEESDEAIALERLCMQGSAFRLAFRRATFHARAQAFAQHRIRTVRVGGSLAAIGAVAVKNAEYRGRPVRAAFLFDVRVRPDVRGRGIGRLLAADLIAEAGADLAYTYTMGDNRGAARIGFRLGAEAGGFAYLVLPTFLPRRDAPALSPASAEEVHAGMRRAHAFDLYADPFRDGPLRGHEGSWLLATSEGAAGVSAYTTRGVLEETIVSMPAPLRTARALLRVCGQRVRLPEDGEPIRSWYLLDLFAPSASAGRALLRGVVRQAREREIDWLYLVHAPGDPMASAARSDHSRLLSPVVSYRMWIRHADGTPPIVPVRPYVEFRDL